MDSKKAVMLGMIIGSSVGGYVPSLFGISMFSPIGVVGNVVGWLLGIYIAYRLTMS